MRQHLLRTSNLRQPGRMPLHQHRTRHILLAHTKNLTKLVDCTRHKLSLRRISKHASDRRQLSHHRLHQCRILSPKRRRSRRLCNLGGHQLLMQHRKRSLRTRSRTRIRKRIRILILRQHPPHQPSNRTSTTGALHHTNRAQHTSNRPISTRRILRADPQHVGHGLQPLPQHPIRLRRRRRRHTRMRPPHTIQTRHRRKSSHLCCRSNTEVTSGLCCELCKTAGCTMDGIDIQFNSVPHNSPLYLVTGTPPVHSKIRKLLAYR